MSVILQVRGTPFGIQESTVLGKVARGLVEPGGERDHVLVIDDLPRDMEVGGYAGLLVRAPIPAQSAATLSSEGLPIVHGFPSLDHLEGGDVVAIHPNGSVRTLYRRSSPHNSILLTERCNSFCLMCSQPPRSRDSSGLVDRHLRLVELIDPMTQELGFTGGEPTLLKDEFLRLIAWCKDLLPATALHVLSNGRLFYYGSYARKLSEVGHPDLMVGVPLYSDVDWEHDHVVQAEGAFHQTVVGLQNLARFGVPVEIRVVIHRHTYERLPEVAEFIYRNLTFASHVALMGLEMMGFAVANLQDLWIDPHDYATELVKATRFLAARGMNVSIYNHQLCVVPREVWSFCRQSISDWKNEYLPECGECAVREKCGGFFSSSLWQRYSPSVRPL